MSRVTSVASFSAADLFCLRNKFLVYNLVGRNLKLKFRDSALGYIWSVLIPLATALIYYVVFQFIFRVPVPNYLVYVLSGVLPWTFFSQSVMEGMESLRGNAPLLGKIPMPVHVFPYVGTVTHFVHLILALPVIIGAAVFSGIHLGPVTLLVIYCLAMLFLLAYGFALIFSVGFVFFFDLKHVMIAVMQIWFYATPIVYAESMLPERFHWTIFANPTGTVFVVLRDALVSQQMPRYSYLLASTIWPVVILTLGAFIYSRFRNNLVEQL